MYPFISDSEKNYKALVGLYISAFSGVEFGLYTLIKTAAQITSNAKLIPDKAVQLKRKISILEKAFSESDKLSHEFYEMKSILDYVEQESEFRHNLVHGVNAQRFKVEPWHTMMWRPEYARKFPNDINSVVVVTEKLLLEKYEGINHANCAILGLWARLTDA